MTPSVPLARLSAHLASVREARHAVVTPGSVVMTNLETARKGLESCREALARPLVIIDPRDAAEMIGRALGRLAAAVAEVERWKLSMVDLNAAVDELVAIEGAGAALAGEGVGQ